MLILGLTGSIGMGKSTAADLFREAGVAVHDSDAAVHELYRTSAVPLIASAFPGAMADGAVDRAALAGIVLDDAVALARLEGIVHPLVGAARDRFLRTAAARCDRAVVVDVPLLFETGAGASVDAIVVVTAPEAVQKTRVLARRGMTVERFAAILSKQTPDSEKRRRAHFLIDTSRGFDSARAQVRAVLRAVAAMPGRRSWDDRG